tara:strand:+ start:1365 stop:1511 length:147 start_codon:yes stop_codon:yes gene_type:complete
LFEEDLDVDLDELAAIFLPKKCQIKKKRRRSNVVVKFREVSDTVLSEF